MKTKASPFLIGCSGLAAILLTSCIDPYMDPYHPTTVTTYHAGYEVRSLPHGYRTERIDGSSYYVHGDTYYQPRGDRYVVVNTPRSHAMHRHHPGSRDAYVTTLPHGYRTVVYRGTRYYRSGDVYYQPRGTGYVIVRSPYSY
jgi:hypothetical protein